MVTKLGDINDAKFIDPRPPVDPDAKASADAKFKSTNEDGVFISRKMRRDADAAAKAEVASGASAAEAAADEAERLAHEASPEWQSKTQAEKAFLNEKAVTQARDEARKANGLDTEESRKADAKKAADAAAAEAKAAADAKLGLK